MARSRIAFEDKCSAHNRQAYFSTKWLSIHNKEIPRCTRDDNSCFGLVRWDGEGGFTAFPIPSDTIS